MMRFIKKHPILIVLLLLMFIPASLNVSGFCMAEKRWLSDDEMIRIAIERLISSDRVLIPIKGQGRVWHTQIKYNNVDDFLDKNPDCCRIGMHLAGDYFSPTLWDKIEGKYHTKVERKGKLYYIDKNNNNQTYNFKYITETTNCGYPYEF